MTTTTQDTLVIGAGVIGMTIALALQQRGRQVTIVDRQPPGEGASFGNAGFLAVELNNPLSTPETLKAAPMLWGQRHGPLSLPPSYLPMLAPWLWRFVKAAAPRQVERGRQGLLALNRSAVRAWQRLLDRADLSSELIPSGYLLVWESEHSLPQVRQHADQMAAWDIETRLMEQDALREYDPGLSDRVSRALLFPQAHQVRDPYQLVLRLFERFKHDGGRFLKTHVSSLKAGYHTACAVSDQGLIEANQLVLACGAWSHHLLKSTGINVPLETERGYHLTLPEAGKALRQPVGSAERRFVMTPMDCGLRVVGMTELGGLRKPPTQKRFDSLRYHASALLADPTPLTSNHETWMGFRPTLPDSLPVIDQHPDYPTIVAAFGHQHLGLTQAAITSELVADRMTGQTTSIELSPYRMTRF
jgi:D-hydroxyproline dehydrogenase